jgi:nucleoid DNA-binding protein
MTVVELAKQVAENEGVPKGTTQKITRAVFALIEAEVRAGRKVNIQGFGSFTPRFTPERTMRNPRTGDPVLVPAKTRLAFKPSSLTTVSE